jgi:hypothetical protein
MSKLPSWPPLHRRRTTTSAGGSSCSLSRRSSSPAVGRREEAESLAREAVAITFTTEYVDRRADALLALATVLRLAGRSDDATAAIRDVVAIWDAKGNTLFARRARARLSDR